MLHDKQMITIHQGGGALRSVHYVHPARASTLEVDHMTEGFFLLFAWGRMWDVPGY